MWAAFSAAPAIPWKYGRKADLWCVSATACRCRVTEPEPAAATLTPGKTLVLITTETFGRGGDEAGRKKLMGNFLSTPARAGGEPVARHSAERRREARRHPRKSTGQPEGSGNAGTDVLVCGTALISTASREAKQADRPPNMLDVVTSLALADKVIRP